jgi:hypothetical protein
LIDGIFAFLSFFEAFAGRMPDAKSFSVSRCLGPEGSQAVAASAFTRQSAKFHLRADWMIRPAPHAKLFWDQ